MVVVAAVPWHLQMTWHVALLLAVLCGALSLAIHLVRRRRTRWTGWTVVAHALREVGIVVGLFGLWQVVRIYAITKVAGGIANGEAVWRAERLMRLPSEAWIQRLALPHPRLVQGANLYYLYLHFTGMSIFLVWLFLRHRDQYARWRTTLVLVTAACLAVQFVPVAPPRFLVERGLVDTAVEYGQSVYGQMGTGIADQLSAMPSVHFAWAALIGVAVLRVSRSRWRWVAALHPVLTLYAIVVTANHYWLDAAAAVALLALALAAQQAAASVRGRALVVLTPAQRAQPAQPVAAAYADSAAKASRIRPLARRTISTGTRDSTAWPTVTARPDTSQRPATAPTATESGSA
jgi:PAP2 superfamily